MIILHVPHIKQNGPTHCGVACLEMVYKFFGITDVSQEEIWKKRKTIRQDRSNDYMETRSMVADAVEKEFYVFTGQMFLEAEKCQSNLQNLLSSDLPVIACKQWSKNPNYGHFVVIIGVGDNSIVYLDPELDRKPQKKKIAHFIREWQLTGNEVIGGEFIVISNEKEKFKNFNLCLTNFWVPSKLRSFYLNSVDFTD